MPTFVNQVTVGDIIQAAAVLIASLGLFLNLLQMRAGHRQKRAEYIITLYNQSALDKDIEEIYSSEEILQRRRA